MNPSKSFTPLLIVIGLLVLLGVSWRVFTPHESEAFRDMRGQEDVRQQVPLANTSKHGAAMMMQVGDIATSTLTDSERADILFVFEEEKMARDIYGVLGEALGEAARYRRIHDTLQWNGRPLLSAKRYVICDDVFTTGATINEIAKLLIMNGANAVDVLVLVKGKI
jgi:hypothetical protein